MFCLLLLVLCYNALKLVPFNLNEAETGYVINGTVCGTLLPDQCYISVLALDTPNRRLLIDLGALGKYVIFRKSAYIYDLKGLVGLCYKVNGWNYSVQAAGYSTALSTPNPLEVFTRYTGLVRDIAACQHYISLTIIQSGNIIIELDFSQRIPFSGSCKFSTTRISYNILTLRTSGKRDDYFTLPASCKTPVDYCSLVYPLGNNCIVSQ